jgi:mono/diheme cytochrome c family protein
MGKSPLVRILISVLLLILAGFVMATFATSGERVTAQQTSATPSPVPTRRMPGKVIADDNWLILNLPPSATQVDYGQEIYRLVCSACHGDVGQGLTPEWRSTWAPEDQNCWQSKCHGENHPPEGFTFPVAPAINNLTQRTNFPTALQLQAYIRAAMPWYRPGALTDERAWQVTAYVLKLNGIEAEPVLNAAAASGIHLAPVQMASIAESNAVSSRAEAVQDGGESAAQSSAPWLIAAIFAAIILIVGSVFLRRTTRQ